MGNVMGSDRPYSIQDTYRTYSGTPDPLATAWGRAKVERSNGNNGNCYCKSTLGP